ncbi:MAG: DUF3048 C-terminal domain-containing protein, partial [Oscillospiraceae bacterium]|nr:DUF3048 C-terminal domain-containing protein [Oscillospiraceae bacterium]
LEHEEDYEHGITFIDDGTPVGGADAKEVVCRFSAGKSTTFTYNADSETYRLRQFSRDFIDANDNSHPSFTNILILKTSVTAIRGDYAGRRNIVTVGEGEGYFVCGGKYIEINWFRENKESPFYYTLKDDTPLELGRGKTFICVIPTNMDATFN